MSTSVLDSLRTSKLGFLDNAAKTVNTLNTRPYASTGPIGVERITETFTQGLRWGGQAKFDIQTGSGYCSTPLIGYEVPAPAIGTYNPNGCLNFDVTEEWTHKGLAFQSVNPEAVFNTALRTMDSGRANKIYAAATGKEDGPTGTRILWRPACCFWSNLYNYSQEQNITAPPLDLYKLDSDIKLTLTLKSATEVLASASTTGGNPTAIYLTYLRYIVPEKQINNNPADFRYKCIDFQSETVPTSFVSGVEKPYTFVNFNGSIRRVCLLNRLVSDLDTEHEYFDNQDFSKVDLEINSLKYYSYTNDAGNGFPTLQILMWEDTVNNGEGFTDNAGNNKNISYNINFATDIQNPYSYSSSFMSLEKNAPVKVVLTSLAGADSRVTAVVELDAYYVIEQGRLTRKYAANAN